MTKPDRDEEAMLADLDLLQAWDVVSDEEAMEMADDADLLGAEDFEVSEKGDE